MTARVAVIGAGRSGAVTAACLAELGHTVWAIDLNRGHIATLQSGRAPFYEPRLDELIQRNMQAHRLAFTGDYAQGLAQARFIMLAVGTPPLDDGTADLSHLASAVHQLAPLVPAQATVITRSTVPVGTNRWLADLFRTDTGRDIPVVSNPEFLREGHAVDDFLEPDRIVIGASDPALARETATLYARLDAPVLLVDLETAELIKYASNAYLAASVTFINEIANIAGRVGADISLISKALALDTRIGPHAYLAPGIGFGGSCLPKDIRALVATAEQHGYEPELLSAIIATNEHQPRRVVDGLKHVLGDLTGKRIAVLGISFKGGTFDARSSPSLKIVRDLTASGSIVHTFDPLADESIAEHVGSSARLFPSAVEAVEDCDAVVVATDHAEFRELDLQRLAGAMSGTVLVDGRNIVDPAAARSAGFTYLGVGQLPGA